MKRIEPILGDIDSLDLGDEPQQGDLSIWDDEPGQDISYLDERFQQEVARLARIRRTENK